MIVELIIDTDGKAIGWSMKGENPEEIKKLACIRHMQFWGIEDTAIRYAGRKDSDDANGNPGTLSWKMKGIIKYEKEKEK